MASSVILAFVGNREAIPTPVLQLNLINPLLSSGFGPTKQFAYQEQTVVEREREWEKERGAMTTTTTSRGHDLGTSQRIYSVVTAVETMKFNASNLHANPPVVN